MNSARAKDEDKKVKEREAAKRHRKKKRDELLSIHEQLAQLKLENEDLKREVKYKDPLQLFEQRMKLKEKLEVHLCNPNPDQEAVARDVHLYEGMQWDEGLTICYLLNELRKVLRPVMDLEVYAFLIRLWENSKQPYEDLAGESSLLPPEYRAVFQEFIDCNLFPGGDTQKQRMKDCLQPVIETFNRVATCSQKIRELIFEIKTYNEELEVIAPLAFGSYEERIAGILEPMAFVKFSLTVINNIDKLHRLVAGDMAADALHELQRTNSKDSSTLMSSVNSNSSSQSSSLPSLKNLPPIAPAVPGSVPALRNQTARSNQSLSSPTNQAQPYMDRVLASICSPFASKEVPRIKALLLFKNHHLQTAATTEPPLPGSMTSVLLSKPLTPFINAATNRALDEQQKRRKHSISSNPHPPLLPSPSPSATASAPPPPQQQTMNTHPSPAPPLFTSASPFVPRPTMPLPPPPSASLSPTTLTTPFLPSAPSISSSSSWSSSLSSLTSSSFGTAPISSSLSNNPSPTTTTLIPQHQALSPPKAPTLSTSLLPKLAPSRVAPGLSPLVLPQFIGQSLPANPSTVAGAPLPTTFNNFIPPYFQIGQQQPPPNPSYPPTPTISQQHPSVPMNPQVSPPVFTIDLNALQQIVNDAVARHIQQQQSAPPPPPPPSSSAIPTYSSYSPSSSLSPPSPKMEIQLPKDSAPYMQRVSSLRRAQLSSHHPIIEQLLSKSTSLGLVSGAFEDVDVILAEFDASTESSSPSDFSSSSPGPPYGTFDSQPAAMVTDSVNSDFGIQSDTTGPVISFRPGASNGTDLSSLLADVLKREPFSR